MSEENESAEADKKVAEASQVIGQLQQKLAAVEKERESYKAEISDFLTVLPDELKVPEKLAAFIIEKQSGENPGVQEEDNSQKSQIEKLLTERDAVYRKKSKELQESYDKEVRALKEELLNKQIEEKSRKTFEAMKRAAGKNGLLPTYEGMFYKSNEELFDLTSQNELLILDKNGEVSATTVDDFFLAQKTAFPEMFAGSQMSGSGISPAGRVTESWNGRKKKISDKDILSHLNELRKGQVTLS